MLRVRHGGAQAAKKERIAAIARVDAFGIDVQVRHKAQAIEAGGQHALLRQVLQQFPGALAGRPGEVHEQDVGLRRLDLQALDAGQALGQAARQSVVLGQSLDVVLERMARSRRPAGRTGACRRPPSCGCGGRGR